MSKQDIINYVMDTPHNINPAILNQKLGEMEVQPDWNQNDPTALDYVKNRTHYIEPAKTVEIEISLNVGNEDSTGLYVSVDADTAQLVYDNFENATFTSVEGASYKLSVIDSTDSSKSANLSIGTSGITVSLANSVISTHNLRYGGGVAGTLSIEVPDVVHTIDPKYLPEVIYLTPMFDGNTLTDYCLGKFSTGTPLTYAMAREVYEKYLSGATVLVTEFGSNLVSPILSISFTVNYATVAHRGKNEIYTKTIWPEPIS